MGAPATAKIGVFRATMLVAGNMIGSGVFLMPAAMAQIGGVSSLGWLVALPCALLLAVVFARLATTDPQPGGPYAWARQRLGAYAAFESNALYWLGNVVANVAIAVSVVGYASAFIPGLATTMGTAAAVIIVIWLAVLANIAGPGLVASLESVTTLLGLAPVIAIAALGWFWFQPDLFARNWNPSATPVSQAVPGALTLMFWAFTGVESAAVATDVVHHPQRNVARATLFGVCAAGIIYVASTTVVFGLVPADRLAVSAAPFETAVHAVLGAGPALVMAFCAMMKAAGALGGWTLLVAESGRVSAKDGLFVRLFAKVDRRGVPVIGILSVGVLMTAIELVSLAPTVAGLFGRLVSMSTLMLIPAYLFSSVALAIAPAEKRIMRLVGFVAAVAMVYIASTSAPSDALLALVLVLATAPLFVINRRRRVAAAASAATALCVAAGLLLAPRAFAAEQTGAGPPNGTSDAKALLRPCGAEGGLCGRLTRLLDPAGQIGGTVEIAFEYYPHRNHVTRSLGTIVASEGGPGLSSTMSRRSYLDLFAPLLDERDLLLADNRGTGQSQAIPCEPMQSTAHVTVAAVGACGQSLGPAAGLYASGLAADDLAAVLDRLGITKVDLYGDSYGTFFAQIFAGRHPGRLRSLVLDSAYPVIGGDPLFSLAGAAVRQDLDIVCQRAPSCRDLPGTALERLGRLLDLLRVHPVVGEGHTIDGTTLMVTADAAAIGNILYNGASGGMNERELDPAVRAMLDGNDPVPLLRLIAENAWLQGDARPGGPSDAYSRGLNAAVSCMDYPQLYDMTQTPVQRRAQFEARMAIERARKPSVYAPLTIDEWLRLPLELRIIDLCLEWPLPVRPYPPGRPIPIGAHFPAVPTLVLSGELDALTTPAEGAIVAKQFPHATQVIFANSFHVVALGDIEGCASRMVREFIVNLDPGDLSCAARVRPQRLPPPFPRHAAEVPPALARPGNAASPVALSVSAAAVYSAIDILARWSLSTTGQGVGLRGGSFRAGVSGRSAAVRLERIRWTDDLEVSGLVLWDREGAAATGQFALTGSGGHSGTLEVNWSGRGANAWALLSGTIDGAILAATIELPSIDAGQHVGR